MSQKSQPQTPAPTPAFRPSISPMHTWVVGTLLVTCAPDGTLWKLDAARPVHGWQSLPDAPWYDRKVHSIYEADR